MNIVRRISLLPFIALLALALFAFPVFAATILVDENNLSNWTLNFTSLDGAADFVTGPSTPPLGSGSVRLSTGTDGSALSEIKNTVTFNGTRLDAIAAFSYSTYAISMPSNTLPYVRMHVDLSEDAGSGAFDTLIFHPKNNPSQGTPTLNTWQTWNGSTGVWFSTAGLGTISLSDYLLIAPNAKIGPDGISFRVGETVATDSFDANVDSFTFNTDTYDFEKAGPALVGPPTNSDQCKKGGWAIYNNPVFKNQGLCVSFVESDSANHN